MPRRRWRSRRPASPANPIGTAFTRQHPDVPALAGEVRGKLEQALAAV